MGKPIGAVDYFQFYVDGVTASFVVLQCNGQENLSTCFSYTLKVLCDKPYLQPGELIGRLAGLSVLAAGGEAVRYIHGRIEQATACGQVGAAVPVSDNSAVGGGHNIELRMTPSLQGLATYRHARIFQDLSTLEIIQAVLQHAGFPADYMQPRLLEKYPLRPYCVQFDETDLAFVERLLREQGLVYFFEHTKQSHRWVIGDHTDAYPELKPALPYRPNSGLVENAEVVFAIEATAKLTPEQVGAHSYQFTCPSARIVMQQPQNYSARSYWLPDTYELDHSGLESAVNLRWREGRSEQQTYRLKSDSRALAAGARVELSEHPLSALNQQYLVVGLNLQSCQPAAAKQHAQGRASEFTSQIFCVSAGTRYLPPPVVGPRRHIGMQTAIVEGPQVGEVATDKFGRIRVRFHWDSVDNEGHHQSCWARVTQMSAGAGWGSMFIPRVGQEVLVAFLQGNPDRPIVTGCVYNGDNLPPYALPEHQTRSVIRSQLREGMANELMLEDKPEHSQLLLANTYGHKIILDESSKAISMETLQQRKLVLSDSAGQIQLSSNSGHTLLLQDALDDAQKSAAGQGDANNQGNAIALSSSAGRRCRIDDQTEELGLFSLAGHQVLLQDKDEMLLLKSGSGHALTLADKEKNIALVTAGGFKIRLDDNTGCLTITDARDTHRLLLDVNNNRIQVFSNSGSIEVSTPGGDINLSAKNIKINAEKELVLHSGSNIAVKAVAACEIQAEQITVAATAEHAIKGAPVKIN